MSAETIRTASERNTELWEERRCEESPDLQPKLSSRKAFLSQNVEVYELAAE